MNQLRNDVLKTLWSSPEEFSLTDHQKKFVEDLDINQDFRITGEIGAGKTFAIRNHLSTESVDFIYITASQLLKSTFTPQLDNKIGDTDVVVIDNFDVIPMERTYLEPIHEHIEQHLSSYDRSIWLVLPERYKNRWFETLIRGMRVAEIHLKDMDTFTMDHLLSNLEDASPEKKNIPNITTDPSDKFGYHTVVNSFINAN